MIAKEKIKQITDTVAQNIKEIFTRKYYKTPLLGKRYRRKSSL